MKVPITIEIDLDQLTSYTDRHLAALWHAAQAWPAEFGDGLAEHVVSQLGWEIIRRWLSTAPAELYHHQQRHSLGKAIRDLGGKYVPGGPNGTPEWHAGRWVRKDREDTDTGSDPSGTR